MLSDDKLRLVENNDEGVFYEQVAVAFLDIVGFSALMGDDELATFERWHYVKQSMILPTLAHHHGRYVKSTGDGLLATFPTTMDAVCWATEVQRNARTSGQGLRMRISLNWGNAIIDKDDDIAGDFVNIAARLEQYALPGGIIVTSQFRDAVTDVDSLDLQPIGELKLKNIQHKVRAFHLYTDARRFAGPESAPASARLPSIALLPFDSDDTEAFFCNGMVDDLIVSLSGVQELNVIARSTAKAIGVQRRADPREVGEALGVDYLLSGVVQRSSDVMRVSVMLSETETGTVVATERSVFPVDELFDFQDKIVEKIVARVAPEVRAATLERALRKPPANFTAYEHLLRALEKVTSLDRQSFEEARAHLDAAIAEDPKFAMSHAWSARWRTLRVGQGWSADPVADNEAAAAEALHAIRLDRRNALALATYGHVLAYMKGDYETAIDYLDRAVSAGPSNAIARILRSGTLSFLGRADEACDEAKQALRLSPFDEQLFQFYGFLALACYVSDDFDAAVRWAQRSLAENPNYTHTLKVLVAAMVGAGNIDAARNAATTLMVRDPNFRLRNYRTGRAPFHEPERVDALIDRLQAAGVPA